MDDRFDPNGEPRPLTDRATVRRLPQRGAYDSKTIHAILDAGFLAHVGFCIDGQPFVIPTLYGRAKDTEGPDKLYLHGSAASRMLRELSAGVPACVTVTHVDGIVLARSAFHHSMNYRSVVAFGTARKIDDVQGKAEALRVVADHLIAGRWEEVRSPTAKELKAMAPLAKPRLVKSHSSPAWRSAGAVGVGTFKPPCDEVIVRLFFAILQNPHGLQKHHPPLGHDWTTGRVRWAGNMEN